MEMKDLLEGGSLVFPVAWPEPALTGRVVVRAPKQRPIGSTVRRASRGEPRSD